MLVTLLIFNGTEYFVRRLLSVLGVIEFNIIGLCAPDNLFLLFCSDAFPPRQIVDVFLNDDVATPLCVRIVVFGRDKDGGWDIGTDGVRSTIDETEKIARVEIAESGGLVFEMYRITKTIHELPLELKAEIAAFGAHVEEKIARR